MALEGLRLGRYHLQQFIDGGGMGDVYLAQDTLMNRQVALKLIRPEVTPSANAKSVKEAALLFQREMRAISKLDHSHILPVYDYGEQESNGTTFTYMVMPFRREGTLATWLRERSKVQPLLPQIITHLVYQAADALQYAHDSHIIHRDVKPSNFLIRSNRDDPDRPDLLLADFGIAKFATATATASQAVRGTAAYMAPEQWKGHPVPATDQYALAIMAYELLTGRTPFKGSLVQVIYQHTHDQPQLPSKFNPRIPVEIDRVILRALAKQPEDRFPSISAFARALQLALLIDNPTIPNTLQPDTHATHLDSHANARQITNINRPPSHYPLITILLVGVLILLLIAGSAGVISIAHTNAITTEHNDARATEEAQRTATAQAIATGTAQAIAAATAQANATATSIVAPTATFVAANPDPYPPNTGTPVFVDSLRNNSQSHNWDESSGSNGSSQFIGGAYHVSTSMQNYTYYATAGVTNFSNFTYEVHMTILQGNAGGIVFRTDPTSSDFYYFQIGQDGSYGLILFAGHTGGKFLINASSPAIRTGLNQANVIAVVAVGNSISLYVNQHYITSRVDGTYSHGQIGVVVSDIDSTTEVAFSDARVWMM